MLNSRGSSKKFSGEYMMPEIGVLLLTYNEEKNIENCLESVKWVERIVIVDSYSEDNTLEIAENYNVEIYQKEFNDFSSQRNFGIQKLDTSWVLVIDADERVTSVLKEEILRIISEGNKKAYKIPRKNYFLGKWIKYCGWYPDYTLRLFKNENIYFQGKVHEKVELNCEIGRLENSLIHYTHRNIGEYVNKINKYTDLAAEELYNRGKDVGVFYVVLRPLYELFLKLIIKKGVLLGKEGLLLSVLSAFYKFLKYAKLWEKNRS